MNAKIRVTDHAVIRYLERVQGVDIAAIRRELAGPFGSGRLAHVADYFRGAEYSVNLDRMILVVKQNTVVTCYSK